MNTFSSPFVPYAPYTPNVHTPRQPTNQNVEKGVTTTLTSDVSPAKKNEGGDNQLWVKQYIRWKYDHIGKSDEWKDSNIPVHLKPFRKIDKAANNELKIQNYSLNNYVSTPTPRESTSAQIKEYYKKEYGMDIDPDKTYLITFAYNVRGNNPPYPGAIVSKISLTDAAIKNIQDTPGHPSLPNTSFNKYESTPPPIQIEDQLTIGYPRSSGRHSYQNDPKNLKTQQYEGIYFEPGSSGKLYDSSNQAPITPKSFRNYVWNTNFSKPHKANLESYWNANRESYITLSKMAFTSAAHKQFGEGSLSKSDRDMALKVANISADKPLESLTAQDFQQAYTKDPNLKAHEVTYQGYVASGMFYVTNEKTKKTLLYMTGNSSPIHPFDNPEQMRKWLCEQMADADKCKQFSGYFQNKNRENTTFEASVDKKLEMTGRLSKDFQEWPEGQPFGGKNIEGNPFKPMQARVEQYTYNNTEFDYVSNDDIKKKNVLELLAAAGKALILLAPVGMAFPAIGYTILLYNLGVAATEVGFGIDDASRSRPGGGNRIAYGLFNAGKVIANEFGGRYVGSIVKPNFIPQVDPK